MAMMFSNCKPWRIDHGHGEFKDNYFDNNRQLDITISNMATRTGKDNYRFRSGRVRDRDKDRWSEPKTVQLEINYPHLQKNMIYIIEILYSKSGFSITATSAKEFRGHCISVGLPDRKYGRRNWKHLSLTVLLYILQLQRLSLKL